MLLIFWNSGPFDNVNVYNRVPMQKEKISNHVFLVPMQKEKISNHVFLWFEWQTQKFMI